MFILINLDSVVEYHQQILWNRLHTINNFYFYIFIKKNISRRGINCSTFKNEICQIDIWYDTYISCFFYNFNHLKKYVSNDNKQLLQSKNHFTRSMQKKEENKNTNAQVPLHSVKYNKVHENMSSKGKKRKFHNYEPVKREAWHVCDIIIVFPSFCCSFVDDLLCLTLFSVFVKWNVTDELWFFYVQF